MEDFINCLPTGDSPQGDKNKLNITYKFLNCKEINFLLTFNYGNHSFKRDWF